MAHSAVNRWQITEADPLMIGYAESAADYVCSFGYRVDNQMSIFSAISIASSISTQRRRTVLSILE